MERNIEKQSVQQEPDYADASVRLHEESFGHCFARNMIDPLHIGASALGAVGGTVAADAVLTAIGIGASTVGITEVAVGLDAIISVNNCLDKTS